MTSEFQVVEVFEITGRGAVAAIDEATDLDVGCPYSVSVITPSGETLKAKGFKDFLLRRHPVVVEKEAITLVGLHKEDIPVGSVLRFEVE